MKNLDRRYGNHKVEGSLNLDPVKIEDENFYAIKRKQVCCLIFNP